MFRITIPSKTQAYLAAGKPIIMAVRGDAAQLVTESKAGLTCEPENFRSLFKVIEMLVSMPPDQRIRMGEAGKKFYNEHLSLKTGVRKFEEIFATMCGKTAFASQYDNQGPGCVP